MSARTEYRNDRGETVRRDAGSGPWSNEPDKVSWIDDDTDLDCLAVRNRMGTWCGYVGVPPGHRLHGVDFDDATMADGSYIEVHGGLTFSDGCDKTENPAEGICHVPAPGRPDDVWWLGFDCNHAWDLAPCALWRPLPTQVYRDLAYVEREVARLAAQLAEVRSVPQVERSEEVGSDR